MNIKTRTLLGLLLLGGSMAAEAQQLAFPGAQGWGRFATGGRSGSVYHVTNLGDSGAGSLRDAVSQPNRIVVFDVAGVINLNSRLVFKNNLYVAGQTAPGEGITVYGDGVSFTGASNIIVRHMRFRMGHKGSAGKDCAGLANGANMIFDHCSFAWGLDETFSINPDGKGVTPHNITLQHCVVGQGLMTHSAGGLMQTDSVSLIGNLLCDNSTRNFKVKGINQYANNMVYNWQNGAYIMGGDSEGKSYVNIQSNLFINGPAKGGEAFTGGNADFHCYGDDNWQDKNMDGVFDPYLITNYNAATREDKPYDYPALDLNPGRTLLDTNLPTVGATVPYRDPVDCYMVDEVMSFGTSGALISNEETLIYGAPNTWTVWKGTARQDSDGDGMPDEWELKNGTNPNADDAMQVAANGYTNIENYINSLTVADRQFFLRTPVGLEQTASSTTTMRVAWRDYTYAEEGFAVEMSLDGVTYSEVARTGANATGCTLTALEPGTRYSVRVRAFAGDETSAYTAPVDMSTRPVEVGLIDIDTYQPDVTLDDAGGTWDTSADGKLLLISPSTDLAVQVDQTLSPAAVVVNSDARVTLQGKGAIGGTGSMNKAGEGTLALNTLNTYSGATVLHDGVIEMNTLKNGGEPSSIGQSVDFAQNWVFDGGTYNYTGPSTQTNRSARLLRQSGLSVASGSATLTMNGSFEGSGGLTIGGSGQLTVGTTKFFQYTGPTVLSGGTLYLSTTDISKAGIGRSSRLVMAGGHLKTRGETNGYETYSFPIEVSEGTTSQLSPNRNCYLNNTVTGGGTLQLNIPYLREYVNWNLQGFSGRIVANGVSSEKEGSLFLIQKGLSDLSRCVVETRGNARICSWDTNAEVTLGGLSGDAGTWLSGSSKNTKGFTCTWNVGQAGTDETFRGTINDWTCTGSSYTGKVSIVKQGTGDWRLTGANTYSGTTSVRGGRLIVNGTHSGTGLVNVTNGGTLAGRGTLAGKVTIYNGGAIEAGDTLINANGLTLSVGLDVRAGASMVFPLYAVGTATKANKLTLRGTVSINGATLVLDLSQALQIANDKVFVLMNVSGATVGGTGFASIDPERPSATQVWDTSQLLTRGYLYVREDPELSGVVDVQASAPAQGTHVYNLNGQRVERSAVRGVYIDQGRLRMKK